MSQFIDSMRSGDRVTRRNVRVKPADPGNIDLVVEELRSKGMPEKDVRAMIKIYESGYSASSYIPTSSAAPSRLARRGLIKRFSSKK